MRGRVHSEFRPSEAKLCGRASCRFLALADPKKQRQAFKATLDADFILSA